MRREAVFLLMLAGCLEPVNSGPDCASCHGSDASPAPPTALGGGTDTTEIGVGAHAQHADVACSECHLVPSSVDAEGHMDTSWPAEVVWGPLAESGDLTATWSRTEMTCSNVYCHGGSLTGGQATEPVWTVVDGTQAGCASCHGNPPPPPHPADTACSTCHVRPPEAHGDGVLDVEAGTCTGGCHGVGTDLAPPPDTQGNTDPSLVTVGAHAEHAAVACSDCHVVPVRTDDAGHIDASPAEVTFSGVAVANGATPTWGGTTCSDTWCHGAATPDWTVQDGTQATCGSCHGNPPAPPHPTGTTCANCHDRPASAHIDGVVDLAGTTCTGCHGNPPPPDTEGGTDPSTTPVGAHATHASGGDFSAAVACGDCHVVPTTIQAAGHIDAAPAEVRFAGTASGTFNGSTCTVSCHGADTPDWNVVDGSEATCGSCHTLPPGSPHPSASPTSCGNCHGSVATGGSISTPAKHCDGNVDF